MRGQNTRKVEGIYNVIYEGKYERNLTRLLSTKLISAMMPTKITKTMRTYQSQS